MMSGRFEYTIQKPLEGRLGRAGILNTPHGRIETPAFTAVGTKATVKALTVEMLESIGVQAVLSNTYHLYLRPGDDVVSEAGGLNSFMGWDGPTLTDSGGFQVFSLGSAYGTFVSKIAKNREHLKQERGESEHGRLVTVDDEGVEFRSHIDGSTHYFTPEKSIEIQHNLGADIIFAFDECTSPHDSLEYLEKSVERTTYWARRCLTYHSNESQQVKKQALFGIVQGGSNKKLREKSANEIGAMDFDGFGIGGSFTKKDIESVVGLVNSILPEEKPRHLLGLGEPIDFFVGVENGCDTFDCVSPTRIARNGTLYTKEGTINITKAEYMEDFESIESDCECYSCQNYTRAYIAHLFRSKEMLAAVLASIHNLHFIVSLLKNIRQSILDETFDDYKEKFLAKYYK